MAGVALCAIDGLLVWRVLGLVTSTLRFCGFPKAGLPSCSAPFSRGSASVLLSPPGGLFSVLPAQLPKSIKTDLPSSSALHLLSCAPCSFWLSVLAAQRPKSFKTDLPSSPSPGLLGGAPCCFWWPALVREPPKFFKAGLPSCSFVLRPPFSCDCASVLLSLSDTPFFVR